MYVYKIYSKDTEDPNVYIGSTNNYKKRMWDHKTRCNNHEVYGHHYFLYKYIRQNGGWDNFQSEIIHEFECKDDKEKRMMEQEYINRYSFGLNSWKAFSTVDERKEYEKEYREANKEKINEYARQYREDNKEKIAAKGKIKFTCECGSTFRKADKSKHEKTKKHIKYVQENNIII